MAELKTSISPIKDYGCIGLKVTLTVADQYMISHLRDRIKEAEKRENEVVITEDEQRMLVNLLSKFTTVKIEESPLFADGDKLPEEKSERSLHEAVK